MSDAMENPVLSADAVSITEVVLFSSGVGYFGRAGTVTGRAKLELVFTSEQVNDLLKSLLVLDLDGGQVASVSYASQDPTGKALRAFGIDLTDRPALANLLEQIRGVPISIASSEGEHKGTVLGVESWTKRTREGDTIQFQMLNLVTADGIRSFDISELRDIQILDDNLKDDLAKALSVLAKSRDSQKRRLAVSFDGEGERRVRIAYILEAPVWKTSYRLMLGDDPLLQGWAIVENATDNDWKDVKLSLVAGRPISFIQDLYTPLYLGRPVVQPELYAGLRPVVYGEAMEDELGAEEDYDECKEGFADKNMRKKGKMSPSRSVMPMSMPPPPPEPSDRESEMAFGALAQQSVSAASGGEAGELFAYTVNTPVSVSRQSSAMLPIVLAPIEAEKLSIYNRANHPKHPYNGCRMKNSTTLALLAGPVTVFDEHVYAGDAQLSNMQPDEDRLLSYGLDLACTVEAAEEDRPRDLFMLKIVNGYLEQSFRQESRTKYTIKNKKDAQKTVLIEHPYDSDWELKAPEKFDERTDTLYRFRVEVKEHSTEKLEVVTGRTYTESYGIIDIDSGSFAYYISAGKASKKVVAALERAAAIRRELEGLTRKGEELDEKKDDIREAQGQTRENLEAAPEKSKAYARFLKKLEDQEDRIEKIELELEKISADGTAKLKKLEDFLSELDVD